MEKSLLELIEKAVGEASRNDFCRRAGISAGNFSRIMHGQRPSPEVLFRISYCSKETVSYEELMSAAGYIERQSKDNTINILGSIAAGSPIEAVNDVKGHITLDYDCSGRNAGNFALKVVGDSMDAAGIPNGSVVIVRPQNNLDSGEIGAFRVNGDVTVKRLYIEGNKTVLMPVSKSPEYFPQIYTEEEEVALLGKVIMVLIDFE